MPSSIAPLLNQVETTPFTTTKALVIWISNKSCFEWPHCILLVCRHWVLFAVNYLW